ncbi:Lrp/AsnC family transcriptional regulator [Pseudomonas laurylsulfativorans]|uniref:Lrp/AsnC family transcriptional regulator n=1 Tax=Pseudomonas laurylsulfativorans TaxID=1943631 RepID=UPI001F0BCD55|nr:Lrp/AsnC family transcriptional regulator [Pseudomonas laurylsulfativorans]
MIRGQVAVVDTNKLGVHLTFVTVLEIVKEQKEQLAKLQYWLTHEISVQQAFYTTGSADLYLIVVAANVESYNDVTQRLVAANPIIRRVTTNVTLQTFKKGIFVPTNHDYDSLPR